MVSLRSVKDSLGEAGGRILVLMQEGDSERGFVNTEWADEMFDAFEHVKKAINSLERAEMYEAGN